ncbi:MAG: 1,2-phenylacetyl-CoA epoxidase subunit PaaC [Paracoccaceae bacterium]|nr:1,2-phenylacetyl-CoA epoxidase subunit PaaC [Paracoccaceae bacterium]
MGDNTLVLGHRVSEWCGIAPVLEEDIALANTALDLIGQTTLWLNLAGEIEGKGRDADALAFRRDVWDFRNVLLVEQPNGDFGQTMMRQFLFDTWHKACLGALMNSSHDQVAAIAEKSLKEVTYHLERTTDTVIGLGDGTEESHQYMQKALNRLYPYVGEFFVKDPVDDAMVAVGIAPDPISVRPTFDMVLNAVLTEATLSKPDGEFTHKGGKSGQRHSEHLGHILTQMQWLQHAYPDATW